MGAVRRKVHGKNTTRSMRVEIVPMTALPLDLAADPKPMLPLPLKTEMTAPVAANGDSPYYPISQPG